MTEDVVREALEKAGPPVKFYDDGELMEYQEEAAPMIAQFLKHILEAGPDERMGVLAHKTMSGEIEWVCDARRMMAHIISRLEENTNDS